ncbi:hypothetical protein BJ912DRAFT_1062247 [Pholiota molesta]|nr:hypothetical protein BJ912DRAFT_1062247 [Pholiota molesta]
MRLGLVTSKEAAWKGHTTPGSTKPVPFTPYYIPPGAKSYDSTSPLISYKGTWTDHYSTAYIGKSLRMMSAPNAKVLFSFMGIVRGFALGALYKFDFWISRETAYKVSIFPASNVTVAIYVVLLSVLWYLDFP